MNKPKRAMVIWIKAQESYGLFLRYMSTLIWCFFVILVLDSPSHHSLLT